MLGEAFGAIAALQQESLAGRDLRQRLFQIARLAGKDQRRQRMQLMRRTIKENNVYRWAGRMLMDAARIRQRQALRID